MNVLFVVLCIKQELLYKSIAEILITAVCYTYLWYRFYRACKFFFTGIISIDFSINSFIVNRLRSEISFQWDEISTISFETMKDTSSYIGLSQFTGHQIIYFSLKEKAKSNSVRLGWMYFQFKKNTRSHKELLQLLQKYGTKVYVSHDFKISSTQVD